MTSAPFPTTMPSELQRETVERLQGGGTEEALYLLEHPHVITKGRNASGSTLLREPRSARRVEGSPSWQTDRGGDITYHGPGQLVGYPILQLEPARRDIRRYVTDVEEVLIRTLSEFSIAARTECRASRSVDRRSQDRVGGHTHLAVGDVARLRAERQHGPLVFLADRSLRHRELPNDIDGVASSDAPSTCKRSSAP